MAKPEKFIFVCVNQRPEGHPRGSCAQKGGRDVLMKLAEALEGQGLFGKVSLASTGCLGPCFDGPVAAVFPDNVWYKDLAPADVEAVVREHIIGAKPVEKKAMKERDWD